MFIKNAQMNVLLYILLSNTKTYINSKCGLSVQMHTVNSRSVSYISDYTQYRTITLSHVPG